MGKSHGAFCTVTCKNRSFGHYQTTKDKKGPRYNAWSSENLLFYRYIPPASIKSIIGPGKKETNHVEVQLSALVQIFCPF